ncbi:long-chain fatty acid--CoA ligase [Acidianus brierleyi]|uniref:Long-chain fatty acid--CoA ligase n=1 Tax=Acidianus brierleyi TaxID=41673 RepID=A0A2U9II17_9CREN|nr:long-chain fatty acid--CoA ligase [Acidianus brierleyi]AWR95636.1 long-chain-fatty-acid--CoA ligase [Acidianus brierleyi]
MSENYNYQLTVDKVLEYGERVYPDREIVYRDKRRYTFESFGRKVRNLAGGLQRLGVKPGDKVGVIDWDTDVYLMSYYAIPMMGAMLHTVNVRYPPELIVKTILHAEDKWLIVRDEFLPLIEKAGNYLNNVKIIAYSDENKVKYPDVMELINNDDNQFQQQEISENTPATIFYTSGTTGEPKGVWFTHRDLILHAMSCSIAAAKPPISATPEDVYLILVPLFHVHQWGYPYLFMLGGNKYVLPGRYDPTIELNLMKNEGVTFSAMVPTILYMILSHPDAPKYSEVFKNWRVLIGGAALPKGLADTARKFGITVMAGYGLSETAPVLTISYYNSKVEKLPDEKKFEQQIKTGVPIPLVELRVVDPEFKDVPHDGNTIGEIVVRAPWLTREYYKDPEKTKRLWSGGWLHTGDLAVVDEYGYIRIVDRDKDAIKSGGEFIPSLLLEDVISSHPKIGQVAVVGMPDEKWGERPVAFIVLKDKMTEEELKNYLMQKAEEGKIRKWWIPDKFVFLSDLPKTSTNKIDKKSLRDIIKAK